MKHPFLRPSVAQEGALLSRVLFATVLTVSVSVSAAQQLLDSVVARVGSGAITQTDLQLALAFGVVDPQRSGDGDPLHQLIDRRLMLIDVNRFPPPEPSDAAVMELAATMKTRAGGNLSAVMKRTGADDKRVLEIARDTLRIQSYIAQRFGSGARVDQQVARWLEDLRARGDVTITGRP